MRPSLLLPTCLLGLCLGGCDSSSSSATLDLSFGTSLTYTPTDPVIGNTVTFTFAIANSSSSSSVSNVTWRVSRTTPSGTTTTKYLSGTVSSISAASSTSVSFTLQESVAGSYTYTVTIDYDNAISETDESNNSQSQTITFASTSSS